MRPVDGDDDYFAPPPRSPVPAAIVASIITSLVVFVGLKALDGRGLLPAFLSERAGAGAAAEVPRLVGLPMNEARAALQAHGWSLSVTGGREDAAAPTETILEQTPPSGTRGVPGGVVKVVVSRQPRPVVLKPLAGLKAEAALRLLAEQQLRVAAPKTAHHPTIPAGNVVNSDPPAGTALAPRAVVSLIVSAGPSAPQAGAGGESGKVAGAEASAEPETAVAVAASPAAGSGAGTAAVVAPVAPQVVPRVVGMRLRGARELLQKGGWQIGKVRRISDGDRVSGVIVEQRPTAASNVQPGSAIDLTVND